ncbi:uncharacterized protein C8orf74 homolog [Anabas testudineus]|uniref:uncharacterized protein C8orf74 homolog n=1 Tax=Anabas testudineus TaxID=64144 RepID=UPI000E45A5B0|nr:uncharacterized protein C8orf74 homolog [Anabas testudineus]
MASPADSEVAQIVKLQRDAGVQRLSSHFSWPEFCDERQRFHQEFVYDVAMFAAARGFPWSNVIQAAVIAKGIFPQLDGHDVPKLLFSLKDALSECLPNLTPVHRQEFIEFLTETCVIRLRLFQAVVNGAANISTNQLHLELQLPPKPCPLAQGTDLHEWEHQRRQAQLTSTLQQKEAELRSLRNKMRVNLEEVSVPVDEQLDTKGVVELVRAAVKNTEGQLLVTLDQEVSLLCDVLQLKLQQAALATGRLYSPVPDGHINLHADTSPKENMLTAKATTGVK